VVLLPVEGGFGPGLLRLGDLLGFPHSLRKSSLHLKVPDAQDHVSWWRPCHGSSLREPPSRRQRPTKLPTAARQCGRHTRHACRCQFHLPVREPAASPPHAPEAAEIHLDLAVCSLQDQVANHFPVLVPLPGWLSQPGIVAQHQLGAICSVSNSFSFHYFCSLFMISCAQNLTYSLQCPVKKNPLDNIT
jgi:hypothetical protein